MYKLFDFNYFLLYRYNSIIETIIIIVFLCQQMCSKKNIKLISNVHILYTFINNNNNIIKIQILYF